MHFNRKVINREPNRPFPEEGRNDHLMAYTNLKTVKNSNFIRVKTMQLNVQVIPKATLAIKVALRIFWNC